LKNQFGAECQLRVMSARCDPAVATAHVRFAPKADKKRIVSVCPLCADIVAKVF
jgi:hypothetical protein